MIGSLNRRCPMCARHADMPHEMPLKGLVMVNAVSIGMETDYAVPG